MKKLTCILALLALSLGTYAAKVNEEVLKMFSKTYPEAQKITWEDLRSCLKIAFLSTRPEMKCLSLWKLRGLCHSVLKKRYYQKGNTQLSDPFFGKERTEAQFSTQRHEVTEAHREIKIAVRISCNHF